MFGEDGQVGGAGRGGGFGRGSRFGRFGRFDLGGRVGRVSWSSRVSWFGLGGRFGRGSRVAVVLVLLSGLAVLSGPVAVTAAPARATPAASGRCGPGELCLWSRPGFRGAHRVYELLGAGIESCVPLPRGFQAQSLANRLGRPATAYQSQKCAETGEFETYPGDGTWVPESPYRARAFKIWER